MLFFTVWYFNTILCSKCISSIYSLLNGMVYFKNILYFVQNVAAIFMNKNTSELITMQLVFLKHLPNWTVFHYVGFCHCHFVTNSICTRLGSHLRGKKNITSNQIFQIAILLEEAITYLDLIDEIKTP